ncbi:MAG: MlaE family lipid ABC transporter permease subunit [Cyanobacteria bacterium CRU_2_1]|nr:MlaE family lipid ABC transporter permease subunit [Cyanobacteria bacterium RU_5_0]NJR60631.1 MlaE family lipid ABC transporter permease subunit [Cyanobacteria bacterium CRU_2_1]
MNTDSPTEHTKQIEQSEFKSEFSSIAYESWNSRWFQRLLIAILLGGQIVVRLLRGKLYRRNIMEHLVAVGPDSLSPVLLTNFFAGMIFTIQTARELVHYGTVDRVGGAFAIAFCRELAPILTASVIAGQVGSAFAAEIGMMRVTEQIDALQMLRTDPIDYLVVPRVIACCMMLPAMTVLGLVTGVGGGIVVANHFYQVAPITFLESVRSLLTLSDLFNVVIKAFIFGAIVAILSCSWGLTTTGGARGVGRSTTAAVVMTWISIFVVDFLLSLVLFQEFAI